MYEITHSNNNPERIIRKNDRSSSQQAGAKSTVSHTHFEVYSEVRLLTKANHWFMSIFRETFHYASLYTKPFARLPEGHPLGLELHGVLLHEILALRV